MSFWTVFAADLLALCLFLGLSFLAQELSRPRGKK